MYPPNSNGKRTASMASNGNASTSRKKARGDGDSGDANSPAGEKDEKPKPTRGSRSVLQDVYTGLPTD